MEALEFLDSSVVGNGLRNDRVGLLETKTGVVFELSREDVAKFIHRVKTSEFDYLLIGGNND